jgi:hypothetical protein
MNKIDKDLLLEFSFYQEKGDSHILYGILKDAMSFGKKASKAEQGRAGHSFLNGI